MITPYEVDRSLAGKLRRRVCRLLHRRPLVGPMTGATVSFTFDDVPETAVGEGARVLEDEGARGTFYVSAGLCGLDGHMGRFAEEAAIRDLAARGHEIAFHTYGHVDCSRASIAELDEDSRRNGEVLGRLCRPSPHFAYPYGEVSARAKEHLAGQYASLRAVHPGLVTPGSDLNQLPAVGLQGEDAEAIAGAWMDRAAAESAWLILFTHDVRDTPSPYGCKPDALRRLARRAKGMGLAIATVGDVLRGRSAPVT